MYSCEGDSGYVFALVDIETGYVSPSLCVLQSVLMCIFVVDTIGPGHNWITYFELVSRFYWSFPCHGLSSAESCRKMCPSEDCA